MGIKDILMRLLGRAKGAVAENVKDRLNDEVKDSFSSSMDDVKGQAGDIFPDEKQ
jgi:hypothetical protein